jgi:hypothetical protein
MTVGTGDVTGMTIGDTDAVGTFTMTTAVALRAAMVDSMADRRSAVANLMAAVSTVEVASTAADAGNRLSDQRREWPPVNVLAAIFLSAAGDPALYRLPSFLLECRVARQLRVVK